MANAHNYISNRDQFNTIKVKRKLLIISRNQTILCITNTIGLQYIIPDYLDTKYMPINLSDSIQHMS